ncbi:hypothetical protein H6775_03275 [Candidatus Nomurabacteria bacterium]|nr:hypothetical protein [Candidatus Nomurabacteria bacterium]
MQGDPFSEGFRFETSGEADRKYNKEEQKIVDEVRDLELKILDHVGSDKAGINKYLSERKGFHDRLVEKYGEDKCKEYALFHVGIGSTALAERSPLFDFEDGEDSILKWYREYHSNLLDDYAPPTSETESV